MRLRRSYQINGECFRAYVEQLLIPVLTPGDIVIMDNSAATKPPPCAASSKRWRQVLVVAPYSPDFNPIEQAFAKIKHCMRAALKRTFEDTWRRNGSLLATIPPNECNNFFEKAGYASVKM